MMKQKLLLLFAILATAINASAEVGYTFEAVNEDVTIKYKITSEDSDPKTCEVVSNSYTAATIVIPSNVTNNDTEYTVTSIGNYAFYGCSALTSVTIPDGVTSIGSSAFYGTSLYNEEWEDNVLYIGNHLIKADSGITGDYSIKDGTLTIANEAFSWCESLTSVKIPESVTSIGESVFQSCTKLTSVTISGSITEIGGNTFRSCSSLTSVEIPNSVTSIGDWAFSGCSSLTSVEIPNSVTSIGLSAFSGCTSLTPDGNLRYAGTYLVGVADANNAQTTYTIKEGTKWIGDEAFKGCSNMTSVTIPETVTTIGTWAFSGCSALTSVTIPDGVTEIGTYAFYNCSSLTEVTIPDGVTTIGTYTFYGCKGLTSVVIPDNVTSIGLSAFSKCTSLTSVTIPDDVTSIESSAFSGCSSLTSVVIPDNVTSIGNYAFSECTGLKEVTIGNSVASIGFRAFYSCSSVTSLTVENNNPGNISLGNSVFDGVPTSTCVLYVPKGSNDLYAKADQWSAFTTIESITSTLVDGVSYTGDKDIADIDVTYTRTFSSTDWQPLYVPFNMSYEEWKDYGTVAELACVHVYEDGKTAIEFVTVNSGELLPNVPYVIKPTETGEVTFTCTGKQIKAAPADGTNYISCSSPRYIFKLFGNYQSISQSTLAGYGDKEFNGAYVLTAESKFLHPNEGTELKPFRFYITREKNPNGYWSASARYNSRTASGDNADVIYFMVDGQVTGILSVSEDSTDDVKVYNLNGIQTRNPHNGVFIKNGKKVYIK